MTTDLVSPNFASWNQVGEWLKYLAVLRHVETPGGNRAIASLQGSTGDSQKPLLLLAERSRRLDQSGARRGDQCRQRGDDQHDRDDA